MTSSTQHHGDYSDPFSFPNPHSGSDNLNHDFLYGDEQQSDLSRSKSQYSLASPFSEDDHKYNDGPSQPHDSQATLADNASGFGRSGKYQDLG